MGGTPRIWMVTSTVDESVLSTLDKTAQLVNEARKGVSEEALRESPLGLVTSTPQDTMTVGIAKALEKRGWIVSHTIDVVVGADVVVSIEGAIRDYEKTTDERLGNRVPLRNRLEADRFRQVTPHVIYAGTGGYEKREIEELGRIRDTCADSEWALRPAEDLIRLLPSKWYAAHDLAAAFPGEPLVRVRAQESPFERIADEMEKHDDSSTARLTRYMGRIIASAEPSVARRALREVCPRTPPSLSPPAVSKQDHSGRLKDYTKTDALVYLATIGQLDAPMPLRIAVEVTRPSFDWQGRLHGLSDIGTKTCDLPELPDEGVALNTSLGSDHILVLASEDADSVPLPGRWRRRGEPVIGPKKAMAWESEEWQSPSESEKLMRVGDVVVWLSVDDEPAVDAEGFVKLRTLAADIGECLGLWRGMTTGPNDMEARGKTWLNSRPNASKIAMRVAEGLLRQYAPWPEPYEPRQEDDEETGWSPKKCLEQVKPMFSEIANAPLRKVPPNLVANFLSLIQDQRMRCHALPADMKESWQFTLKTQDHTWIEGLIWRDRLVASVHGDNAVPLNVVEGNSFDGYSFILSVGSLRCAIQERR